MKKRAQNIANPTFSQLLLKWNNEDNKRQMPWKGEKDPYKIWLSEIILQQTRVEQGWSYYEKFLLEFPDIHKLAAADDSRVFKLWEGLGYYSRCRNLIATARFISNELNGKFPETLDSIKELKGVGPYTAAAIGSFAFDLPAAVVDGNVFRILARYFGIEESTDTTAGKKRFTELANELLDPESPGIYNQAIMDFGATICKPVSPLCESCVFQKSCIAFKQNKVAFLPVKTKKIKTRKRLFFYFILEHKGRIAIEQRQEKDIWRGLYQLPLVEISKEPSEKEILSLASKKGWISKEDQTVNISSLYKQQLTHQRIEGKFIHIIKKSRPTGEKHWKWISKTKDSGLAFPGFINQFFSNGEWNR